MNDLEILGELKKCYEYLYDILENADYDQLAKDQSEMLDLAKRKIEDVYEEVFEARTPGHNISIPGAEDIIIGDTPSVDYFDTQNDCWVGKGDVIVNGKEYEWWNDLKFTTEEYRRCNICGKIIKKGYCINNGEEYYCSEDCLHKRYTEKEWQEEMYGEDNYWTEWEEEYD